MRFGDVRMHDSRRAGDIGLDDGVGCGSVDKSGTVDVEGGEMGS